MSIGDVYMGIYIVTGGSKGIGEATVRLLRQDGHKVVAVARKNSDLNVDLGLPEGRRELIAELHRMFPDGIDGLVSNAGIASAKPLSRVLSVNYFGAVAVMEGLFDLLEKKHGRVCCVTSASLAYGMEIGNRYNVDNLLVNCGEEARIGALVDTFNPALVDNAIYGSTKMALVRWVRRTAPGWALKGVTLNALAPGAVDTSIMEGVEDMGQDPEMGMAFPIPTLYRENRIMPPEHIAESIVYLVSENTQGLCGEVLYCDGGCAAVLHSEKYY